MSRVDTCEWPAEGRLELFASAVGPVLLNEILYESGVSPKVVPARFARDLETELDELRDRIDKELRGLAYKAPEQIAEAAVMALRKIKATADRSLPDVATNPEKES